MAPRALRPYQVEATESVERAWAEGKPRVSVVLPTGTGKAEPVTNEIPTPDGVRRFGDLKVGDQVYSVDGTAVEVTGVHEQGVRDIYRITFSDGVSTLADGDHLWTVNTLGSDYRHTFTTKHLLGAGLLDRIAGEFRFSIPMCQPTQMSDVVPSRRDREERVEAYVRANGGKVQMDGSVTVPITDDASEIQEIVWSLGGTATMYPDTMHIHVSGRMFAELRWYRGSVTSTRRIVAIEPAGSAECRCITVDHPTHLYLTGRAHIVTHNSTVIASVATRARREGKRVLLLAHRTELLDQMAGAVEAVEPSGEKVGIVAADRDENSTNIVAASFQTLARSPQRLAALGHRDVILADECFPAGTLMADGTPIENVRVGDLVDSWDEETRTFTKARVERITAAVPSALVRVTLETGETVVCTPGHPFLTENLTWVEAKSLEGRHVVRKAGTEPVENIVAAVRVDHVEVLEPGRDGMFGGVCPDGLVYNLEVERTHTYLIEGSIIVHNCHHISAKSYLKVIEDMGAMDDASGVKSCGFTATMYRDDGKALGDVWNHVVFERDLIWAIEEGFLIPPKGKTVAIPGLNKLASIKNQGGDYKQTELDEVMGASVESTVDAILRHCPNAAMIVFAVSVDHAKKLAEILTANGVPARDVTGAHNREYRETAYKDFREGRLNCLVTVQVLTEGADFPRCDTVVMARPTRSKVLFCFDQETEILTGRGWVNGMHLRDEDVVAQWDDKSGEVSFVRPTHRFTRPVNDGERMVSLELPSTSIRVTEDHRVYHRPKGAAQVDEWRVSAARDLADHPRRQVWIPSAGCGTFDGVPLTDDEIRLIAWITTDGSVHRNTRSAHISQSKPGNVLDIERVIRSCGIKYSTYTTDKPTNYGERKYPLVRYTMSFGMPRGRDSHLKGWAHLDQWMFKSDLDAFAADGAKEVRRRWENATEQQWDVFMSTFNAANGANTDVSKLNWTPRSMHIALSNLPFAEWVQAMCVQRGWSASLVQHKGRTDVWMLHAKKLTRRRVGGGDGRPSWVYEEPDPSEQVWCVTVPSGAVVTRRHGKAVILGQCQMVGRAVRMYTDPLTGKQKTEAVVLDLTGVVRDMKLASLTDLYPEAEQQVFDSEGTERTDDEEFMDEYLDRPSKKERKGRLELEDIDLIGERPRSKVLWLRTGPLNESLDEIAFMPLKHPGEYVFLYPTVNRIGSDPVGLGYLNRQGVVGFLRDPSGAIIKGTISQAMDGAEKLAGPQNYIRNDAGWRRPGVAPSERQVHLGVNLGIPNATELSRGELSDRISEKFANQVFRDVVRKYPDLPTS